MKLPRTKVKAFVRKIILMIFTVLWFPTLEHFLPNIFISSLISLHMSFFFSVYIYIYIRTVVGCVQLVGTHCTVLCSLRNLKNNNKITLALKSRLNSFNFKRSGPLIIHLAFPPKLCRSLY